ncbi:high mobility group B protein 14-like [Gossypium australe]|uniref:High mobility group B protein 14-like n=1 Tax=Gossypium australe TaxID=47621 RepID=A0A5B6X819_9ROSI|nr:high mobility group B protein 14-like [Gossypium australe]
MAKKPSKSKNDRSSSTSEFLGNNRHFCLKKNIVSQMALRVKSSEKMKKTAEESVVSERKETQVEVKTQIEVEEENKNRC